MVKVTAPLSPFRFSSSSSIYSIHSGISCNSFLSGSTCQEWDQGAHGENTASHVEAVRSDVAWNLILRTPAAAAHWPVGPFHEWSYFKLSMVSFLMLPVNIRSPYTLPFSSLTIHLLRSVLLVYSLSMA